jgi:hypothetical protein
VNQGVATIAINPPRYNYLAIKEMPPTPAPRILRLRKAGCRKVTHLDIFIEGMSLPLSNIEIGKTGSLPRFPLRDPGILLDRLRSGSGIPSLRIESVTLCDIPTIIDISNRLGSRGEAGKVTQARGSRPAGRRDNPSYRGYKGRRQ